MFLYDGQNITFPMQQTILYIPDTDIRLTLLYVTHRHDTYAPSPHIQTIQTWDLHPLYVSHRLETYSPLRHTQTWDLRPFTSHTDMSLTPLYVTHRHETYAPSPSHTDMSLPHSRSLLYFSSHFIYWVNIESKYWGVPEQISPTDILQYHPWIF